jgi:DNA-binding MarR family transcriptional regulator
MSSHPEKVDALAGLQCACATARQVARVLTQFYDSQLRRANLEAPQFALMMALDKQGPCGPAELGRRYVLDKTTVSRNLKLLERKGWIEPAAANDRRKRQFVLTGRGLQRLAAAKPQWKKAQNQLRASMSPEQWKEMFGMFRTVTHAAQNLLDEASQEKGES